MSAASDMVTQDELNGMIGKRCFEVIREGRIAPFVKNMQVPYTDPGLKASTWDIVKNPNNFGSILRIGFVDSGRQDDPSAELKFVFLMDLK